MIELNLIKIFCEVDDFCKEFEKEWNPKLIMRRKGKKNRFRKQKMCMSEIMTIIIYFHLSGSRTFKNYYTKHVSEHLREAFPELVSYNRFVELMKSVLVPLAIFLKTCRLGDVTGISYIS